MVVSDASIRNIMEGMESTAGVRLHNHRRKLKQRFDIIKKLGQGTYGKVQLGINKETGQEVAIKTIKKAKIETEADLIRIRREIQIMSSVQHPNIIHIYEVFENREKMVLVMEYAAGGELYDYLSDRKVLTEEESRRIFRQIATAVYYCHKHKICHRDLKLENILLDEHGSAKIADFGLSNVFNDQRLLSTFCGSPLYASPEIVKGTPYHGPEVDCWSLGVLLYTLVYGAMPFDGSNFKRLVRQISNGDYFEPKKPSPASPLIRDMLNVAPARRADIEKICSHWWVNKGYEESCLDVAEELANQTPVRLDLLLSLAPPGPGVGSDKLMVGSENDGDGTAGMDDTAMVPARSQSVGSLMELDHPTVERKIREFETDKRRGSTGADYKDAPPKRKLEDGISTEDAAHAGAKRKDRSRRRERERSSERRQHRSSSSSSKHAAERIPLKEDATATAASEDMEVDVQLEGAVALPSAEEVPVEPEPPSAEPPAEQESPAAKSPAKSVKKKTKAVPDKSKAVSEKGSNEQASSKDSCVEVPVESASEVPEGGVEEKDVLVQKHVVPSEDEKGDEEKVVGEAVDVKDSEVKSKKDGTKMKKVVSKTKKNKSDLTLGKLGSPEKSGGSTPEDLASPTRTVERRRSKIFETAEKFNHLLSGGSEPAGAKPKKVFIPGVKVSDAKQAFERKSSISGPSVPSPGPVKSATVKKVAEPVVNGSSPVSSEVCEAANPAPCTADAAEDVKVSKPQDTVKSVTKNEPGESQVGKTSELVYESKTMVNGKNNLADAENEDEVELKLVPALPIKDKSSEQEEARIKKLREAREIISNAITEENKKDIGDIMKRIAPGRPPVPAIKTKSVAGSGPTSPTSQLPEKKIEPEKNDTTSPEKKSSKVEIILKSATLPRRKTSKAEIKLDYPNGKVPPVEFRTEVAQMVGGATLPMMPNRLKTQRSEVAFPVAAAPPASQHRAASLEPEGGVRSEKQRPREHIIPIHVEAGLEEKQSPVPPAARPPVPPLQHQRSQRSSLSRQSTADSDTDSTISVGPEPIRKSPREYIIPIAVEGGGYVTPRAGSLEPSTPDQASESYPLSGRQGKLSRPRRMSGLLGESGASEDEGFNSAFSTLHRHSRDSDNPDDDRPFAHMHRLRSSRPRKHMEHADSVSSAEEDDDDDDNFEILTAESLFSTLLSRVRSLTQRLNVEDSMRPGFQSSRLLSQLANSVHPSSFISSVYGTNPSRRTSDSSHFPRSFSRESDLSSTPWRRSISVTRDASDGGNEPKRGCVKPDSGTPNNDAASEPDDSTNTSPYYYTPSSSVSRYLQKQYSDVPSREDYIASVLRSLECGDKTPSRRLSRTLSTRAYSDGRPQSALGTRNYLPLTRRSLSLLESAEGSRASHRRLSSSASDKYNYNYRPLKSSSFLADRSYKGSSASDCGDYVGHSMMDTPGGNVLPPLPYTISSHRRRDSKRNYGQQFSSENECSGDKEEVTHTNTDIKRNNLLAGELSQPAENITSKESSFAKRVSCVPSSRLTGGVTLDSSHQKMLNTIESNTSPASKSETSNDSKNCEINSKDQDKKVTRFGGSKVKSLSSASSRGDNHENKHRSQIPSLLRFRSLSVSRELDPSKSQKDTISVGVSATPEKSILSKFFRQGSEDKISGVVSGSDEKDKRKSGNSTRRISRFLRPDFFDTPREESVYAKQKEAKKSAEAEERALARKKKLTEKLDAVKKVSDSNKAIDSDITAKKVSSSKRLLNSKKSENSGKDIGVKEEKKTNVKMVDVKEDKIEKKDNSVDNVSRKGDKVKSETFVKQTGKNSFLHSLEKRLEKFCSSGDGAIPTSVKNSRVDKAIRSLRESSVAPPSSATSITESNLLKRAVSADDCSSLVPNMPTGNSTSKVNSVLGLFRRLESTTPQNQSLKQRPKRPTSMIVDQVKRSQAAYTGSHSDSVLLSQLPVKLEDKVEVKINHKDTKDVLDTCIRVVENAKPGKTISVIHKPNGKSKVIKDEQDVASSVLSNKIEAQVVETEKDSQLVRKEPVRCTNLKSIPRPTSLKGLKDTVVEAGSSEFNNLTCEKVAGHPKQHVPEVNIKLLGGRPGTGLQTDTATVGSVVSETAQQFDDRSKCLELSFPADDAPSLVSPGDESGSHSFDSWSVSSDLEGRENLSSPIPPYPMNEGIEESVSERIRRKSFYSRFNNTNRRSRKSSVPVLSSSFSSSLRDSSNLSQSRKMPVKQSSSHTGSSRSQSLYPEDNLPSYGRKSPIHNRRYSSQYSNDIMNNIGSVDVNENLQNGFPTDRGDECNNTDYGGVSHLDSYYVGDYSPYTCRSTERRLSRPTDFIKDVRRSSSLLPGLYSSLRAPSSVSGHADSTARYGLPEREVYHHGKNTRYNSQSAAEPPLNSGHEEMLANCCTPEQVAPLND